MNLQTCGILINYEMPLNPMRVAGDGLIIDLAAEELSVVGRSVRRSLDTLRQLAGPTVFEIDEATGRHRHWYARGVKPLFAANVKVKRRQGRRRTS